jgi:hypothetical protein
VKPRTLAPAVLIFVAAFTSVAAAPSGTPTPPATYVGWTTRDNPTGYAAFLPYGGPGQAGGPPFQYAWTPPSGNSYKGPDFLVTIVAGFDADVSASGQNAPAGQHFVAAHIVMSNYAAPNTSTQVDVLDGSTAIAADGSTYAAVRDVTLSSRVMIPGGSQTLGGADAIDGWLVFLVPINSPIAKIHVAPKGIYAGAASWLICGLANPQNC